MFELMFESIGKRCGGILNQLIDADEAAKNGI